MNNSIRISRTALNKKQFDESFENIEFTDAPLQGIVEVLFAVYTANKSEFAQEVNSDLFSVNCN